MQVWDLSPGYLNDEELLTQRHWVISLLANRGKPEGDGAAQARHWSHCLNALRCVEAWINAECRLRELAVSMDAQSTQLAPLNLVWPKLMAPGAQLVELANVADRAPGRIPLPQTTKGLWTHHKYSVAARSMDAYRAISVKVATGKGRDNFDWVAAEVMGQLRVRPSRESLRDALMQMWGYVAAAGAVQSRLFDDFPALFAEIQKRTSVQANHYLLTSTALSELSVWLEGPGGAEF
ncbi:hypothetical protein QWY82_18035 [Simiduia curdlanivorans]|uniref:Uncharacterized protein n=1 Tax=Simiduia curdlanivorans TaxID=1492769 RepID=A0ABV8V596_9GAMM|nr:hypothetical protein [Simiduia curdlanivorans]MDN3640703.1 hypothetical protein [Simiduia curdlanivorans]